MTDINDLALGWIPDLPDHRDYSLRHPRVSALFSEAGLEANTPDASDVDLTQGDSGEIFVTPPSRAESIGASSAIAIVALLEYFERRVRGNTFDGSERFLYKVTRRLRWADCSVLGDTGADLRTTLKVLHSVGLPDRVHVVELASDLDAEPSSFAYKMAKPREDIVYFRLDEPNQTGETTWRRLQSLLASGFPVAFGFSVPSSLGNGAEIPHRWKLDGVRGGVAALAVGLRHDHFGRGQHALRVRLPWGESWGDGGFGWLPAAYVYLQVAQCFWTIVSPAYLDPRELRRPACTT